MSTIDSEWAIGALQEFVRAPDQVAYNNWPASHVVMLAPHQRAADSEIAKLAHVTEQILDRVRPEWRHADDRPSGVRYKTRWTHLRGWAGRSIAALRCEQDLCENPGGDAPQVSANQLHRWVWSVARSRWESGHYRSAVEAAAKNVNVETKNKVGRRDICEADFFKQAFSLDAPAPGKSRLRRKKPDGTDTYKSVQRGAWALAEGNYAGIRNPFNQKDPTHVDKQTDLKYLAALSVLARRVDEAEVEKAL